MGAFHQGHASLMRAAHEDCDVVVVSLFVNPKQFADHGEVANYPRDEERDAAIAAAQGVDLLFAPDVDEIYPDGFATTVSVGGRLVETLRRTGLTRDGQLPGMCTIITKLLNIVQPDTAFFGEKDLPHWVAVERMVRDLDLPFTIKVLPTVREADGLAMSSRNVHLGEHRAYATALYRALTSAAAALRDGEADAAMLRKRALAAMAPERESGTVNLDYFEILDLETLEPVATVTRPVLFAVGAQVGAVGLLDILRPQVLDHQAHEHRRPA
jgi:pantoate--beta-alanine ligase